MTLRQRLLLFTGCDTARMLRLRPAQIGTGHGDSQPVPRTTLKEAIRHD
jgi:hypothetical protein